MKFAATLPILTAAAAWAAPLQKRTPGSGTIPGFDISGYQPDADLAGAKANGAQFVIIKATEGTDYTSDSFSAQYDGATSAGLIRGAYHFANPDASSGAAQATFFLQNGGGWSNDGITLPGMIDLESEEGHAECYGLSASGMVDWVLDFANTYKATTGRPPMVYANAGWLNDCLGGSTALSDAEIPLVIAHYTDDSTPGSTPGWSYATFWQWADSGTFPGDQDVFNGSADNLAKFAKGS